MVRPICYETVACPVLSVLSCLVCDLGVLWTNGWTNQMKLDMQVGLVAGHIALDGDPGPLPKKGAEPPVFCLCPLRPDGCMDHDAI